VSKNSPTASFFAPRAKRRRLTKTHHQTVSARRESADATAARKTVQLGRLYKNWNRKERGSCDGTCAVKGANETSMSVDLYICRGENKVFWASN
jgi:hypothetical protein